MLMRKSYLESKAMVVVYRMNVHTIKVIMPTLKQERKLPKSLMIKACNFSQSKENLCSDETIVLLPKKLGTSNRN